MKVPPVVNSISPSRGLIGTNVDVTISGTGLTNATSISAGSGISATITSNNDTQIQATFGIASNAPGGTHNVTVSTAIGTSGAVSFFVQIPTSLMALSTLVLPTGTTGDFGCTPSLDFGIKASIRYQILDQQTTAILSSAMEPQETITNFVINGGPPSDPLPTPSDIGPSRITGTSQFTDSSGQFLDAPFGTCGDTTFTQSATQGISVLIGSQTRFNVRTNNTSSSSSSLGHGSLSNGVDVSVSR
jgi:IPT/TIG domain